MIAWRGGERRLVDGRPPIWLPVLEDNRVTPTKEAQ